VKLQTRHSRLIQYTKVMSQIGVVIPISGSLVTKLRHLLDLHIESCHKLKWVQQDEFGGVLSLAEVRLQEGESLENALRRFKRKVQQEDIIKEVKRHSYYLKPGEKKRTKEALARKRSRKKARKEQD
jgi:small subunit ribosomal protein S21